MIPTFTFEGNHSIFFGSQATLIEQERECASEWASSHIRLNPAHAFVLGKFVEADRANLNNQYFSLEGLQMANPTIAHAPMNLNHNPRNIMGAFVDSELIYPEQAADITENAHPYIESLGVIWKYYFPKEYQDVKTAAEEGDLFYSMECVPRAVSTVGGVDDSIEYPYEGRNSPNYPDELNERSVPMNLVDPHFVGGALVIPPAKPGWNKAEVTQVAQFMKDQLKEAELAYEGIAGASPDLESEIWESLMGELILMESESAKDFSQDKRDKLAKKGEALPDGSFPIENEADLKNAIQAVGRAKNRGTAVAHIKKRAAALGLTKMLPESWTN